VSLSSPVPTSHALLHAREYQISTWREGGDVPDDRNKSSRLIYAVGSERSLEMGKFLRRSTAAGRLYSSIVSGVVWMDGSDSQRVHGVIIALRFGLLGARSSLGRGRG
jgi:hypothetical protein